MLNSSVSRQSCIEQSRAFAQLFRWPVAILSALAGCATIYILNPDTAIELYLLTSIILACTYSAACAINDYWDIDKDRINHPERPLPSGRLSRAQARWGAIVLFTTAAISALHLGIYLSSIVGIIIVLLWHYSEILNYSGILGNALVATVIAGLIVFGGLVAGKPFALTYSACFLFVYQWAKEIVWDVHDAAGDRARGVTTIANLWGAKTAFILAWGAIAALSGSIPIAFLLLPMSYPLWFSVFVSAMMVSLALPLAWYQRQRSAIAYDRFIFWERLSMVLGIIGLLGTAPA